MEVAFPIFGTYNFIVIKEATFAKNVCETKKITNFENLLEPERRFHKVETESHKIVRLYRCGRAGAARSRIIFLGIAGTLLKSIPYIFYERLRNGVVAASFPSPSAAPALQNLLTKKPYTGTSTVLITVFFGYRYFIPV
jgi:hypothetical protein